MTAFARKERRDPQGEFVWEIRSVNHRYLETSIRLPEDLRMIETAVRERIGAKLSRGKVDCGLRYRPGQEIQPGIQLNHKLVKQLTDASDRVGELLGATQRPTPMQVLLWPGIVEQQRPDMTPVQHSTLALLDETLKELVDTRQREGDKLAEQIGQRSKAMREQISLVKTRMPMVLNELRQRLNKRFDELKMELEPARLEQEMVLLMQRLDVDEEMDRLNTHLDEVERVLKRKEPIGRRLDFLMQELNREANTLTSKSSDVTLTQAAVEMKVLIEQMREQIQNLE
jgi:uncharacterized protein (TIGR00255 family)